VPFIRDGSMTLRSISPLAITSPAPKIVHRLYVFRRDRRRPVEYAQYWNRVQTSSGSPIHPSGARAPAQGEYARVSRSGGAVLRLFVGTGLNRPRADRSSSGADRDAASAPAARVCPGYYSALPHLPREPYSPEADDRP